MRRKLSLLVFLLLALPIFSHSARAAWFTKVTPEQEVELGRQACKQIERTMPLSQDPAMKARVERVGRALLDSQAAKPFPFQFKVLAVKDINAFCVPGGFIYIYEGLLNQLPDDNALAFVLGHEMAHAAHRDYAHTEEKMESVAFLGALASALAKDRQGDLANLAMGLTSLRYSRKDENDADSSALDYIWQAGFDLSGGTEVMACFIKIEDGGGKHPPKFLLTHPPPKDRLARVKEKTVKLAALPRPPRRNLTPAPPLDLVQLVGDITPFRISYNLWFPLATDNEWRYQVKGGGATSYYTIRVVGVMPTPTGPVYRLAADLGGKTPVYYQALTTAEAVYRRNRPALAVSPWLVDCAIKFPPEGAGEAPEGKYRLLDQEPITLPCGNFVHTLHISKQGDGPDQTEELWLAEGIGLVKRICSGSGVEETLISYQVTPPPAEPTAENTQPAPSGTGIEAPLVPEISSPSAGRRRKIKEKVAMRLLTALSWFLVMLIAGAIIWLALFSVIFFPLVRVIPSSDTILISLVLLTLLLGLPAFLSAAASTRVWRKQFCRFGSWIGIIPPVLLTLALIFGFKVLSQWEAVFAVMLSFVIGLAAASYTNRVCSLNNKPRSKND